MQHLEGRVAVVTGAASGIGLAMARRLARAGMKLALADIEGDALEAAARPLREAGGEVATRVTDVSDASAVEALRDLTLDTFGGVHVVCNNAGVGGGAGPLWTLTQKDWDYTFGANLHGVIHGIRLFAPLLVEQNEGHIVNTASMAGLVALGNMGPYNVTKYGVVALSETLFEDLRNADSDVGVSVLCPAFVRTQIWDSARNRPEALRNDSGDREVDAERTRMLRAVIEGGLDPSVVADAVHDAILEKKLYILTHAATGRYVERRMRHIIEGTNPTPPGEDLGSLQTAE